MLIRTHDAERSAASHGVKLLDFGIAKLVGPESENDRGVAIPTTKDSGWALTPQYAAPEQLTGGAVTTATDVYSLGVLLYALLSGQHPAAGGLGSPASLIEVIVEREAPRLSDSIAHAATDDTVAMRERASKRRTTPDSLRHALMGDLDTIVAKALKKNPQERYPSVTAFADDLRRYLNDHPIAARPDAFAYRAAKFVHRHRAPVALASVAALALAAGLIGTFTQARRATRQAALAEIQRQRADQEARTASAQRDFALRQLSRAEAISDLNAFLLSDTAPSAKPFTASELLGRAEHVVERQRQTDENHIEMLISLGRQYSALGEDAKAENLLSKAYDLSRAVADPGTRARAACALATPMAKAGEGNRAEQLVQEGLATLPNEPQFILHRCSAICAAARSRCGGVRSRPDSSESARRRRCSPTRSCLPRCWTIASRWLWRSSTQASGVIETPFSRTRMRPAPWPLLDATTPKRPATCSTHGARFCRSSAARWRRNRCSGGGFGSRSARTAARNRRWRSSSCSLPAS